MNKEKLITIIFPSRERYDLVEKLLQSIEKKTYDKDWIEVISKFDLENRIQELIAGYQLINKFKNKDFINL